MSEEPLSVAVQSQSVVFGSDTVEITYVEPRDLDRARKSGIMRGRVSSIPNDLVEPELEELREAIQAVIDAADVAERTARERDR